MSFLINARDLALNGFYVFPLKPGSKLPLFSGWQEKATRDLDTIRRWWVDPTTGQERPYNIGISTSKFGDEGEALIVVDVDNKNGKNGDDEILRLEIEGKILPQTYTQETPSGGRHYFYKSKIGVQGGTSKLAKGIDILSTGRLVAGRGSKVDAGYYRNKSGPLAEAPRWLIETLGRASEEKKKPKVQKLEGIDEVRSESRALFYLQHEAPMGQQGDRNDTAYKVASEIKRIGLEEGPCLHIMCEHWQCEPPLDESELALVIRSAYKGNGDPIGASSPEAQFPEVTDQSTETAEELSYLEKMNKEYALIYVEGSHFILHETISEKGGAKRVFLNETTFKRRFSPLTVQQGKGQALSHAQIWLDWKGRREYKGVCFTPEREPRHGYYNLWRGFAVKPMPHDQASVEAQKGFWMFIDHAKENVCHGNEELFLWLMGYFAHMVQRPYERPLTTLVFRGSKGVGKNALIDRFGNLLGNSHYLVAHDGRYLTSNFNGHLDSCLCLVLDEAFWSGDKAAEGKLKGLTTAPEILIERKGKEPYSVDNLVRLIVIGNEDWLVPASADERRYAVFHVGEGKKQNRDYFHKMRILMDQKGGAQVLLHYLQNFDLSRIDVNAAPSTEALFEQKVSSLDPFQQWWLDCLNEGRIVGSEYTEWTEAVDKDRMRSAFRRYIRDRQIRSRIPGDNAIGKNLKTVLPSVRPERKRRDGELINIYAVPNLQQCRKEWAEFIGHKVEWEKGEE